MEKFKKIGGKHMMTEQDRINANKYHYSRYEAITNANSFEEAKNLRLRIRRQAIRYGQQARFLQSERRIRLALFFRRRI